MDELELDPYSEGYQAAKDVAGFNSNPYLGSYDEQEWNRGWEDSIDDQREYEKSISNGVRRTLI